MPQVEWGPSMETTNGTRQNVNGGKLENNTLVQEIDLSYAILPSSRNLDSGKLFTKTSGDKVGFRYTSPLVPARFERVLRQLGAVSPWVDKILVYQYQGMMNQPGSAAFCGSPESAKLYTAYVNWLHTQEQGNTRS